MFVLFAQYSYVELKNVVSSQIWKIILCRTHTKDDLIIIRELLFLTLSTFITLLECISKYSSSSLNITIDDHPFDERTSIQSRELRLGSTCYAKVQNGQKITMPDPETLAQTMIPTGSNEGNMCCSLYHPLQSNGLGLVHMLKDSWSKYQSNQQKSPLRTPALDNCNLQTAMQKI